jgi:hypothetical protein
LQQQQRFSGLQVASLPIPELAEALCYVSAALFRLSSSARPWIIFDGAPQRLAVSDRAGEGNTGSVLGTPD